MGVSSGCLPSGVCSVSYAVGGEVQVREQLLAGAEAVIFLGHRLLDLHDQVGRGEHLVGGRHDRGADGGVLVVGEPGPDAGAGLHDDLVTVVHQLHDPVRSECHPLLVVLDLARYSDDERAHGVPPPVGPVRSHRRGCREPRRRVRS
jgi:hypothetical protein